eukprot:9075631-Pyramimonas_sp.AAC.1
MLSLPAPTAAREAPCGIASTIAPDVSSTGARRARSMSHRLLRGSSGGSAQVCPRFPWVEVSGRGLRPARLSHLQGFSRAGWSVVQIDPAGNLIGATHGAAPLHAAPGQAVRDGGTG